MGCRESQGMKANPKNPSPDDLLSEAEVRTMARRAVTRTFPKNTVVVSEGDRTDTLHIIVSGRVKIYVSDEKGKEIILNQAGPGEYFGELVLDGGPRAASVRTLEPSCFLVVPQEDLREFVAHSPDFALHLVRKLIRRVRVLTGDIKSLALMDVYGRVARMLLELAVERDGALVIEERPTQQEMANRVGASREMISKILGDLASGGYIAVERGRIRIARALPRAW